MARSPLKGLFSSIQAKLILIGLVTWLCLVLAVGGLIVVHRINSARPFHANAVQYFTYVVKDLGTPPDMEKAQALALRTGLNIAYFGPEGRWSTIQGLDHDTQVRFHRFPKSDTLSFGRYKGKRLVRFLLQGGTYIFEFSEQQEDEKRYIWLHLALALILTLIVAGAYLAVKKTLTPIRWLRQGVDEVARGNLAHRLPERRQDEFGQLARAFNTMTLRLSQMLTLKQQLLRDVSHELRSPLTRAKVALEFVAEDQTKESIRADLKEMESMVSAILESARIHHDHTALQKQDLDLTGVVREAARAFQGRLPGIQIEDGPAVHCRFDPERIKTVLGNLLDNALKYSPKDAAPVTVSCRHQEGWAHVLVQDRGPGMDPSKIHLVTEPFFRLDRSRSKKTGGYGLGLSLCKTIMEAHGGKLLIDSLPGRGTRVSLHLPLD